MLRTRAAARLLALVLSLGLYTTFTSTAQAQVTTEERFQDLFLTAGYTTAFGAALGTAVLFLNPNIDPAANLRFIAMGASLGFIGGSIFGGYVVFSPLLSADPVVQPGSGNLATAGLLPERGLVIRPTYNTTTHSLASLEGGMTLLRF